MISFIANSIRMSAAFLLGSTGEIITEKSGHLNLGIPGIMCMGMIGGTVGAQMYVSSLSDVSQISPFPAFVMPLLFCIIFAGLMGVIYSFMTVTLRSNQNITGLALTTFGMGVATFLSNRVKVDGFQEIGYYYRTLFTLPEDPNWFSTLFLSYGMMVYLAIIIAIGSALILRKTRTGLQLRAVGENPATADAAGVNITRYRYLATIIGSAIAGMGGLFYCFDMSGGSLPQIDSVSALGWLSIAIVIFSIWKPDFCIVSSIVFGILYRLPHSPLLVSASNPAKALIGALPYAMTVVVLIVTSIVGSKKTQPPASLGLNYFREER